MEEAWEADAVCFSNSLFARARPDLPDTRVPIRRSEALGHDLFAIGAPAVVIFCRRCGCFARAKGGMLKGLAQVCRPGPDRHKGSRANTKPFLQGNMRPSFEGHPSMPTCGPDDVRRLTRADVSLLHEDVVAGGQSEGVLGTFALAAAVSALD